MQVLIVLSSADPEIRWNTFRFGNFLLEKGEEVTIFLNGPAANYAAGDGPTFPVRDQARLFALSEGILVACGKCLDLHGVQEDETVRRGSQQFLYDELLKADKVLNF